MGETRSPDLTVGIPSVNGWDDLQGCLRALATQSNGAVLEVIVADRVGESVRAPLRKAFPGVRILEASGTTTIPALRAMAFRAATAEVVGVIEDHVLVPPEWAARMLEAHGNGAQVVGGAVENAARGMLVDRAAFFCEYSHCLEPWAGTADWLPGNNVTYRKRLLDQFRDVIDRHQWENQLHDALRCAGVLLESRPDIRVGHCKHYRVAEYVRQRYLYARAYAALRLEGAGVLRRIAWGCAACALPPVLLSRIARRVWRDHTRRPDLAAALPLLALFVTAWAVGEAIGYWCGPGDALSKVC